MFQLVSTDYALFMKLFVLEADMFESFHKFNVKILIL